VNCKKSRKDTCIVFLSIIFKPFRKNVKNWRQLMANFKCRLTEATEIFWMIWFNRIAVKIESVTSKENYYRRAMTNRYVEKRRNQDNWEIKKSYILICKNNTYSMKKAKEFRSCHACLIEWPIELYPCLIREIKQNLNINKNCKNFTIPKRPIARKISGVSLVWSHL
jgi:hypothetical protein